MEGLTESMQHYIEVIYKLEKEWGSASVTDIAKKRGVKASSVTYMLKKLDEMNMITYRKYRNTALTPLGTKIAQELEKTHKTLKWFLELIGVEEEIADADACEIEHHLHPETMKSLFTFAEWVKDAPKEPRWLSHFEEFVRTGKRTEECV